MKPSEMFPAGWEQLFVPDKRISLGMDIGTTEGKKSNPTALAIAQEIGVDVFARLVIRYKSADPRVTIQAIEYAIGQLKGVPCSGLALDATSEKYFASNVERHFRGKLRVIPVVSSESIDFQGKAMSYKAFLGNMMVNHLDDGRLALPPLEWLEKDIRSVQRAKGSFEAEIDKAGNHADCFDAIKLALYVLLFGSGGPVEAAAVPIGYQVGRGNRRLFDRPDHSDDDKSTLNGGRMGV
jgi:hypothetical protein